MHHRDVVNIESGIASYSRYPPRRRSVCAAEGRGPSFVLSESIESPASRKDRRLCHTNSRWRRIRRKPPFHISVTHFKQDLLDFSVLHRMGPHLVDYTLPSHAPARYRK